MTTDIRPKRSHKHQLTPSPARRQACLAYAAGRTNHRVSKGPHKGKLIIACQPGANYTGIDLLLEDGTTMYYQLPDGIEADVQRQEAAPQSMGGPHAQ